MKMIKSTLLLSVILFLSACGQKGPLYLPTPEEAAAAAAGK